MALPKWQTPAGNLGVVPELEFYKFGVVAADDAGGQLAYSVISGTLPPGIQLISSVQNPTTGLWEGVLTGTPVSTTISDSNVPYTLPPDLNQTYTFTIRVVNLNDNKLSDRTFNLTITNVAPPIIIPKTNDITVRLNLVGNITANIGDTITQAISNSTAVMATDVINSSVITVTHANGEFTLGVGNLSLVSANTAIRPSLSDARCYPISSQSVSMASVRNLGVYFDGTPIVLQLQAIEFIPGAPVTWRLKNGTIPPGLTLSADGLISGYIYPIPATGLTGDPGWDDTPWDDLYTLTNGSTSTLGWDFSRGSITKGFNFSIEATDGVNSDLCIYQMLVVPKNSYTADGTDLTIDTTYINGGNLLTVATGPLHNPVILSTQADLLPERQNSWFSFHVNAVDIDGNALVYSIPQNNAGTFDEQVFIGESINYIADTPINGMLYTGVFPKTVVTYSASTLTLTGTPITANVGEYITQTISGANARITSNVTTSFTVTVINVNNSGFKMGVGNISIGGLTANTYPTSVTNNTPTVSFDYTAAQVIPGSRLQVLDSYVEPVSGQNTLFWYDAVAASNVTVQLSGNTIISGSVGNWLTQSQSGANLLISNISPTTGFIDIGGNLVSGTLTIQGNLVTAKPGDIITQASTGANAIVTATVISSIIIPVAFIQGTFSANILGYNPGNITLNGQSIGTSPTYPITIAYGNLDPVSVTVYAGDVISQASTGATANVITDVPAGTTIPVVFTGGTFATGVNAGNITINGNTSYTYPATVGTQVNVSGTYQNPSNTFIFNVNATAANVKVNGVNANAIPTSLISVGINENSSETQGTVGFDSGNFDQGVISLPGNLTIQANSGWMTGRLPIQSINQSSYNFQVFVRKVGAPEYVSSTYFTLDILGDLNNTINWLTPSNLGTIENGKISDLYVEAISSKGKTLYYSLSLNSNYNTPRAIPGYTLIGNSGPTFSPYTISVPGTTYPYTYSGGVQNRLPQGLMLTTNGLLSGRVSFELFSLDQGATTLDVNSRSGLATTFDNTYTFNITAADASRTVSAARSFTIRVLERNPYPYEDLYLKAFLNPYQRLEFQDVVRDPKVFPSSLIYRPEDPYYGVAKDLKSLFLAGLNPNLLSAYANAVATNHATKRITLGQVKSAVATVNGQYDVQDIATGQIIGTYQDGIGFIPTDFSLGYITADTYPAGSILTTEHVKYEVVYVEVLDPQMTAGGLGPADTQYPMISNPYYDLNGNAYTTAYPDAFTNMTNVVVNNLGYANKGALPDWMTSKQPDGRVLGFTRAVVLAYTKPGAGATVAYRFARAGYDLNQLDFTVDRYELADNYSANYDIVKNVLLIEANVTYGYSAGTIVGEFNSIGFIPNAKGTSLGYSANVNIPTTTTIDNTSIAGGFIVSRETTFDRYPPLKDLQTLVGSVDYAVNIPFDQINDRTVAEIVAHGGLDGITNFSDGQTLVFYNQQFTIPGERFPSYNDGWSVATAIWDTSQWDWDNNTPLILTDDQGWDGSTFVPGYREWLAGAVNIGTVARPIYNYTVPNKRIGIWTINIDSNNNVTLVFTQSINFNDTVFIRNGISHSGQRIYYDNTVIALDPNAIPGYSPISSSLQTVATTYDPINHLFTTFDSNGTKFFNYRDSYSIPEQGDKYIKFAKTGVFT